MEGTNFLLLGKQVTTIQGQFMIKTPKIHYKKKSEVETIQKNHKCDLRLTFGQLLTFGQTIDQSQHEP